MRAPDAEADDRHRAGTDPPHSGASAFDSLRDGNAGQPPQRRSALPLAAAAFVGAVAASVLVGWWTGSAALVSLFPDLEPMPFDAALALLAGALGLACVDRERHAPARVLAAFLIALGAITLV